MVLDAIERTYSDDGKGSGYALPLEDAGGFSDENPVGGSPSIRNVPGLLLARKAEEVQGISRLYDAFAESAPDAEAGRGEGPGGGSVDGRDRLRCAGTWCWASCCRRSARGL
ncbi:MAG: hypothetical protein R3B49_01605 [Phycisphaerales bacterium]